MPSEPPHAPPLPADPRQILARVRRGEISWDAELTRQVVGEIERMGAPQDAEVALDWAEACLTVPPESPALALALCELADHAVNDATITRLMELRARIPATLPLGPTLAEAKVAFHEQEQTAFAVLHATAMAYPEWSAMVGSVAWHWARRGLWARSEALFAQGRAVSPGDGSLLWGLGLAMLSRGAHDALRALVDELPADAPEQVRQPAALLRDRLP